MTLYDSYFHFRCEKGLKQKGLWDNPEYRKRLDYEIDIITRMGFCEYFLTVMDILEWAKREGIPCGPGRGSIAGSICSFSLGITVLDPIKYGLLFERFINPCRMGEINFKPVVELLPDVPEELTIDQLWATLRNKEDGNGP